LSYPQVLKDVDNLWITPCFYVDNFALIVDNSNPEKLSTSYPQSSVDLSTSYPHFLWISVK